MSVIKMSLVGNLIFCAFCVLGDRAFAETKPTTQSVPATPSANLTKHRMETTHTTESAPLNLINRSFNRLEDLLNDSWETQRLTYRAYVAKSGNSSPQPKSNDLKISIETEDLKRLLVDLGGGAEDVQILNFEPVTTENQAQNVLNSITTSLGSSFSENGEFNESIGKLGNSMKAALVRDDVKMFSVNLREKSDPSKVVILVDEETSDVLLLYLTQVDKM